MCGRYNLTAGPDALEDFYDTLGGLYVPRKARFNIAPGQGVPVIVMRNDARELTSMHWGLIPHWAKDKHVAYRMINARSETAHEKPAFRALVRQSRCLIPATGWYEWQKLDRGKQPHHIHLPDNRPFAFAGLWTRWQPLDGEAVESCTILTTQAHPDIAMLHERMPVALTERYRADWLSPEFTDIGQIQALLGQTEAQYTAYPVSNYVNKPANAGPECVVALGSGSAV